MLESHIKNHLRWSYFAKIINDFQPLQIFAKSWSLMIDLVLHMSLRYRLRLKCFPKNFLKNLQIHSEYLQSSCFCCNFVILSVATKQLLVPWLNMYIFYSGKKITIIYWHKMWSPYPEEAFSIFDLKDLPLILSYCLHTQDIYYIYFQDISLYHRKTMKFNPYMLEKKICCCCH